MFYQFLEWIFWFSIAFVLLVTFGYPFLLLIFCLFKKRRELSPGDLESEPTVSLIISAYNEEEVIETKIKNSLALDYPEEKLEIVVASDGSTDETNNIVRSFENRGIILYEYERLGKTGIQNETVKKVKGEFLVFSDANAMYDEDAIRKLVRNFTDDKVGCVCGQLTYKNKDKIHGSSAEISYWDYEKYLKKFESRVSSLIGANGSIYAVRKSDYVEIGSDLISDLVEPLEIVKKGKRVVYEHDAISMEESSPSIEHEFKRKVRILTRSIHGILHMKELFNPLRYGIFAIQLLVHKLFRYLIPFFLVTAAISLVFLTHEGFYYLIFCLMMAAIIMAIMLKFTKGENKQNQSLTLFYYYILVNYAVVLAWGNVIGGNKITIWSTERD